MVQEFSKTDSIFWSAVGMADPAERHRYLDDACAGDPDLRRQLDEMLAAYPKVDRFLETPACNADHTRIQMSTIAERTGSVIGAYKLLEQIGEGGMGVVFMAEQTRPIQRIVAIKIIKPGMDTRQVIARFEAERQALAMMDHPNIAKVLDAGTTSVDLSLRESENISRSEMTTPGRPYFVMDLVKGIPITDYCDEQHLSIGQRLHLMTQVCHAVQHAHQKGIIHRDLKPSNVLVAEYDGDPVPKVIDFGVAKATAQKLTERTMFTQFGQLIGTFEYMSPEQARFNQLDVDTRSDIYSLGVLLYELLTGSTPLEKQRVRSAAFDEILRIISEEEPPKPSTRLSSSQALPAIAENRHTEPTRLGRDIRGELDWIVMKCLEKDRNRRYESASGLANDIQRHLNDEPVLACPPSTRYRVAKFANRNKSILAAGGAIAAALTFGLGLTTWQYFRASTENARAQAVSNLLQEMLGSADAARAKGVDYKVRELLDDFSTGLGSQLTDQPEVVADIHATIGRAYRSVQRPDQAQPHFVKAIERRRQNDGPQGEKLADVLVDYGWNLRDQQRFSEAESQLNEALEIYRARCVAGAPVVHALEILQHVLISAKRDEDAERVTQRALEIARQADQEFPDHANLLHRYADLKIRQGHFADAEILALESVDLHRRLHGQHHPETGRALRVLSRALVPQQKLMEAEEALRQSLVIFRHQFPEDHPNIRDTNYQLRTVLEARGDKSALDALAKEEAALAIRSDVAGYHARLAESLIADKSPSGDTTDVARQLIQRAMEEYGQVAVDWPDDLDRRLKAAQGFVNLVEICVAAPGFSNEVDELNRRLEAELPKIVAAAPEFSDAQFQAAITYREWGFALYPYSTYLPTGEHAYRESIKILEKLPLSDPRRPGVWTLMADSYLALGVIQLRSAKLGDAKASITKAKEIFDQHASVIAADPVYDVASGTTIHFAHLALLLASTHSEDEADEYIRKAAEAARRVKEPADSVNALGVTALAQQRLGDQSGYRATCEALVDVPVAGADDLSNGRAISACCLGPDALEDLDLLVKRAEEFAAHNSLEYRHFGPYLLGAALFRDGQYKRAADELKKSIDAYPANPPLEGMKINSKRVGVDTINSQRLFLAMTQWQLGLKDESRQLLAETQAAIDEEIRSPTAFYNSRAVLEVLRREAEALIGPKEADEAVENESTNDE